MIAISRRDTFPLAITVLAFAFLGLFLLFWHLGADATLNFAQLRTVVAAHQEELVASGVVTCVALLFFGGATGKSAQIPLYVWLPDAMEGPTPVSALIHAATMVTAGVYLLHRTSWLFALTPDVLLIVAWIGAFTALLAAVLACVQDDIKRVLAYSTVSQLGYMMTAIGAGYSAAGFFHLATEIDLTAADVTAAEFLLAPNAAFNAAVEVVATAPTVSGPIAWPPSTSSLRRGRHERRGDLCK